MIGMKLSCNGGFLGYANENAINVLKPLFGAASRLFISGKVSSTDPPTTSWRISE